MKPGMYGSTAELLRTLLWLAIIAVGIVWLVGSIARGDEVRVPSMNGTISKGIAMERHLTADTEFRYLGVQPSSGIISTTLTADYPAPVKPRIDRFYAWSVPVFVGGSALDAGSTAAKLGQGCYERNPAYTPALKVAVTAGWLVGQHLILRATHRNRTLVRTFAWTNVAIGAGWASAGAHNLTVRCR